MGSCAEKKYLKQDLATLVFHGTYKTMDVSAVIPPSTAARKTEQIDQQGGSYRVCLPTLG